jgi:tetratricopeptide (TPR) repeat protein
MAADKWLACGAVLAIFWSGAAQARSPRHPLPPQCATLLDSGHYAQAVAAAAQALPRVRHPQYTWSCMGQAHYRLGQYAAASRAFAQAYALSASYIGRMQAAAWLGLSEEWQGKRSAAEVAYRNAYIQAGKLGRRGAITKAAISLAAFYGRQEDYPAALGYYQKAYKRSRPDQQAVILADVAEIQRQAQDYQQSAEALARAVALDQENQTPALLALHKEQLAALSPETGNMP